MTAAASGCALGGERIRERGNKAMGKIGLAVLVGLIAAVLLMVSTGFVAGSSVTPSAAAGGALSATKVNTTQTFSFASPHPKWNSGNLCVPVVSGTNVTCTYGGSYHHGYGPAGAATAGMCGCHNAPLTYNFSGSYLNYTVDLSNLNQQSVYLNFAAHHSTITIVLNGCMGGSLNVSVLGQATTLNLKVSTSNSKVALYLYPDQNHYYGWISGRGNSVSTYFVSARPTADECPAQNQSRTSTYWFDVSGFGNSQSIVYVNGVGYSTPANGVSLGWYNSAWFENTTSFTCSWSWAPASTCTHSNAPAGAQAAVRLEE